MKKILLQSVLLLITVAAFTQGKEEHNLTYNFGRKYVIEINPGVIVVLIVLIILAILRKKKPPRQ